MRYEIVLWPPYPDGYLNRGRDSIYSVYDRHRDRHVRWTHSLQECRDLVSALIRAERVPTRRRR